MEFVKESPDKKAIVKQDIGINSFLIENNVGQIEKILDFFQQHTSLLLVNGFMGTGKFKIVKQALSFLKDDVITLYYNCFETTILDDILLEFFDTFKKLTAQNIIQTPKVRAENFTQKINSYFESIDKPIVIVINSFEQLLKDNKPNILNFLYQLSKSYKIKIILIGRKFNYADFEQKYEKISVSGLEKGIFEKYLRSQDFKQIGPLSDELYRQTRGYYFYTTLAMKVMKLKRCNLGEFLSEFAKSFVTFNDFILREALSFVDPISGHLFRFLTIMRHPINVKLLETLNLFNKDRLEFFIENMLIEKEGSLIYLQDYYKFIAENSITDNIAQKIHKSCVELYKTQLPLKPLERDLLISRQTMRTEIEYHSLYLPKKPAIIQRTIAEPQFIQTQVVNHIQPTIKEKDEQIKKISFVFESEADEMAIMNKIATYINKFVDITDKKNQALEEIKDLPLTELVNLAKKEEQNFEYQKVVMIYQKALTMNNDDDYYTYLPTIYSKIADAFKNMSDWFNAQKYYELAVEFYISAGDIEKICENKYEIANIFYITFKPDRAERLLTDIIKENISINLLIKSQLMLSNITGKWALKELPKNIDMLDTPILAELYFKYALNFDKDGDIEKAVKYYKKCIETSQNREINKFLSSALANLASIYDEEGKSAIAIKYLQESLRLDELSQNNNGIYTSAMKLAEIYASNSQEKTLEYLFKAKNCANELKENFYIASADVALGDFYYNRKDYKKALSHYNNAKILATQDFSKENITKIELRIEDIKKVYNEG